MIKRTLTALGLLLALMLAVAPALGQPAGGTPGGGFLPPTRLTTGAGDITAVNVTAPISGGGLTGSVTIGLALCTANQVVKMNAGGTAWTCAADTGGITNSAGANVVMKSDGTNAVASQLVDDGSIVTSGVALSSNAFNVGRLTSAVTDAQNGYRATAFSDGNNYIDSKTFSGGSTVYRTGEGAGAGTLTSWLTVDSTAGATTWVGPMTLTGTLNVDGNTVLGNATTDRTDVNGFLSGSDTVGTTFVAARTAGFLSYDDTAMAVGVGGSVMLGGKYRTDGLLTEGGGMKLFKTNATTDDYSFDLAFSSRLTGGEPIERMRIYNTGAIAMHGDLAVAGTTTVAQFKGTWISPSAITGLTNDWNPTDLAKATAIYISASGSVDLTGLAGGADGREITLTNSSGNQVVLYSENGNSTAANRFSFGGVTNVYLTIGQSVTLRYKGGGLDRWTYNESWQLSKLLAFSSLTVAGTFEALAAGALVSHYGDTVLGDAEADKTTTWGRTHFSGAAPTLSGCTGTCSMDAYSTGSRGRITCTDDSGADCTVTFATAYTTNAPACSLTYEDATAPAAAPYIRTVATTAFSFDQVGGAQAHAYSYHCDGML